METTESLGLSSNEIKKRLSTSKIETEDIFKQENNRLRKEIELYSENFDDFDISSIYVMVEEPDKITHLEKECDELKDKLISVMGLLNNQLRNDINSLGPLELENYTELREQDEADELISITKNQHSQLTSGVDPNDSSLDIRCIKYKRIFYLKRQNIRLTKTNILMLEHYKLMQENIQLRKENTILKMKKSKF